MSQRADHDASGYSPADYPAAIRAILGTEFSERFADYMRNRMVISFHKYGPVADGYPDRVDAVASLRTRLERYVATGNAEWLVDVANFALIEFMYPRHPAAHFEGTDSAASPGRTRDDSGKADGPNVPVDAAVERLKDRMQRSGD